jgi:hypothetical protein
MSSRFAFAPSTGFFFLDTLAVAQLDKPKKTIAMIHNLFRKEIEAFVENTPFKVAP